MTQAPCLLLPWDSEFFGIRVARVAGDTLTPDTLRLANEFCRREEVRCLYFLSRMDDPVTIRAAEDDGFRYVDTRVTFERALPVPAASAPRVRTRLATAADVPALAAIAREAHTSSRFYFDASFPRESCARLYETWIRVSCEGSYADAVIVADWEGSAAGYVTCHVDESPPVGRIGLVGVGGRAQGRGLGDALVRSALEWFGRRELPSSTVVTQGRNIPAQRLYQKCGYATRSMELWYHKHYPAEER